LFCIWLFASADLLLERTSLPKRATEIETISGEFIAGFSFVFYSHRSASGFLMFGNAMSKSLIRARHHSAIHLEQNLDDSEIRSLPRLLS
jgi:hypothetical protein